MDHTVIVAHKHPNVQEIYHCFCLEQSCSCTFVGLCVLVWM